MELISDIEHATAVAGSVCAGVEALRGAEFWKIGDKELLTLAETLERVGRLVYAAQVHLTGELDTRNVAQGASTMVLLRDRLRISAADARARVIAARAILPRDLPSGGETPPALPELRDAVDAGTVGVEQTRTVIATMKGLPAALDPDMRDMARRVLTAQAQVLEPRVFSDVARQVALRCDPDGTLDEKDPVDTVELTLGSRNTSTGLTGFKGFLDDLGVEIMSKAIDGLAAPRPAVDGTADPRPAKVRRGQALVEVLRRFLDLGFAPTQGGERPHVTVTMDLDALRGQLGTAVLDHGGPITAAQARMLACDAKIIPAVLGSASQVLPWAPRSGCSRTPSAAPSPSGTGAARSPAATGLRRGATRTMRHHGRKVDAPATRMVCFFARIITDWSIRVTGRSASPPTVSPNTSRQHGSTRPAHHDAI